MLQPGDIRRRAPAILKALVVGIPVGWLFDRLGAPLPWMIGPMIVTAAFNVAGVRMEAIPFGRQLGQVAVGSAVALYFTPAVLGALAAHLDIITAATVFAFAIGGLGALTLTRATGIDRKSAFFASVPGGAMEMAVLADRHGASVPAVALSHSLRVTIVVLVLPFTLAASGAAGEDFSLRPQIPLDHRILWPWLLLGVGLGALGSRLKMQNAYLLLPIFFGGTLTASDITLSAVPGWMIDVAQLMFGLTLGARYERDFLLRYRLFIPFALFNAAVIIVLAGGLAVGLAVLAELPVATVITGMAPGGFAEMTITAQVLGLGVPLVVAFHLFRVVVVNMGTHYLYLIGVWLGAKIAGRTP